MDERILGKEKIHRHSKKKVTTRRHENSQPSKHSTQCFAHEALHNSKLRSGKLFEGFTSTPSDIFSDEEIIKHQRGESKFTKKKTEERKRNKFIKDEQLTDFEYFSDFESDSEKESLHFDTDFLKMSSNVGISPQYHIRKSIESSSEEENLINEITKLNFKINLSEISGVSSDHEVKLQKQITLKSRQKGKMLIVIKIIHSDSNEMKNLSGSERKPKPRVKNRVNGINPFEPGKTPQTAVITDEEVLSEIHESQGDAVENSATVPTHKNKNSFTPKKIPEVRERNKSPTTIPKIVVSHFDSEEKHQKPTEDTTSLRQGINESYPMEFEENAKSVKKNSEKKIHALQKKCNESRDLRNTKNFRKKGNRCERSNYKTSGKILKMEEAEPEKKKLQIDKQNDEPSDSDCMFLKTKSTTKKKTKVKNVRRQKEKSLVTTDVEELENSDTEVKKTQQRTHEENLTDLEDLEFLLDSEAEPEEEKNEVTEAEVFQASSENEKSLSSLSVSSISNEESFVQIQNWMHSNWNSPEEVVYMKNYAECTEAHTDVESIDLPEIEKRESKKSERKPFANFEDVSLTSKSNFSGFVNLGKSCQLNDVMKVCLEQKHEKSSTKKWENLFLIKDWSEKGQSEEYAYETKGIILEPEPNVEARQPTEISKPDRDTKIQNEEKSEEVKFYEIDEKEEILSTGNDPVPQVTMPSFKKRVHSQRIPQPERAAVTPYEGPYDEKYSSDEENIEYEVCEPEDITERSNSTITFSEDIYDSDTIDEMIRNHIRKTSQILSEGSVKSEDIMDGNKSPKSILKNEKNKENIKEVLIPGTDESLPSEKISEGTIAVENAKILESAIYGINKKDKKGEKLTEDVTKPLQNIITDKITDKETSIKGERENVTIPFQSTIPLQIDQITDSYATNQSNFAKNDEKLVKNESEPLQNIALKQSGILTEALSNEKSSKDHALTDEATSKIVLDPTQERQMVEKLFPTDFEEKTSADKKAEFLSTTEQSIQDSKSGKIKTPGETVDSRKKSIFSKDYKNSMFTEKSLKEYVGQEDFKTEQITEPVQEISSAKFFNEKEASEAVPFTRIEVSKTAMKLIEDITTTVENVFSEIPSKEPTVGSEEIFNNTFAKNSEPKIFQRSENDFKVFIEQKISNGILKQFKNVAPTDTRQFSKKPEENTSLEAKSEKETTINTTSKPADTKNNMKEQFEISEVIPVQKQQKSIDENTLKTIKMANETIQGLSEKESTEKTPKDIRQSEIKAEEVFESTDTFTEEIIESSKTASELLKLNKKAVNVLKDDLTAESDKISNGTAKTVECKKNICEKFPQSATEGTTEVLSKIASTFGEEKEKIKDAQAKEPKVGGHAKDLSLLESQSKAVAEDSDKTKTEIKEMSDSNLQSSTFLKEVLNVADDIHSNTFDKANKKVEDRVQKDSEKSMDKTSLASDENYIKTTGEKESAESEAKPRVIFRIDSEDELQSDGDSERVSYSDLSSPTEELTQKLKRELKESLEKDQIKIEERLTSLSNRIFDISNESLSKTKELVDERLRKISEIKPPQELEEPIKKEKSPPRAEEIKIGRFHITPALVEEVVSKSKEQEIAERLKITRADGEVHDELEKELPEKLTEADLEEVIRELKKEGLKTDVYLQPETSENEEKKERTLKRVERRFERMASETLDKEKEEGISEEKLYEKREIEFQQMVSNLSSDEVAEYQQEYLQLWEEGGLNSLTPTDDWESRDPDTPEHELDDDSPKKSDSFRGPHGTGITREPTESSEPKKGLKSPTSPTNPPKTFDVISSKFQPLTPMDPTHVGSLTSATDVSDSSYVSKQSDDILPYEERKKFWEQMSSSQSSETASELSKSMIGNISSVESVEIVKATDTNDYDRISVKTVTQKFEKEISGSRKTSDESNLVKSLTETYSKKIAAEELIMPVVPLPKSLISKESLIYETEQTEMNKIPDSSDTATVSALEVKLKLKDTSAPITEETVIQGSTELEQHLIEQAEFELGSTTLETKKVEETSTDRSTNSETEFISKYGVESVTFDNTLFSEEDNISFPLFERKKTFESYPDIPIRTSEHEKPDLFSAPEFSDSVKKKRQYFEEEIRKEAIAEHTITQEDKIPTLTEEKKVTPEIEEAATSAMTELIFKGVKIAEETLRNKEKTLFQDLTNTVKETRSEISSLLNETHEEKNETEENEKEKYIKPQKTQNKKEDFIPSITVTATGKKQPETGSIGESEDTQSESDVTPEDARMVDNGDAQWDGSGTQSGGFSPKEDIDYPKEIIEMGIGRWIGQEDLSKQSWEKDDLDSCHFKIPTKWERTRSEGASPKEHYVCTPEEHYPDTVWEVPVQEQLEKEEITHDIPIEKQIIIEKDEDEYEDEEEGKVKITEEEAREIAEEILEYIQFEVENRSSFLINEVDEGQEGITQAQVTDYLRHLTGGKEFDDQDVELIESILAKKQKSQFWKSQCDETTGHSVDITDEELRSSGADNDISPIDSLITKFQNLKDEDLFKMNAEIAEKLDREKEKDDDSQRLKDIEIIGQTIAEVKESLEAAQEQLIEQRREKMDTEIFKKESSEFDFKKINYADEITEPTMGQTIEWQKLENYETMTEEEEEEAAPDIKKTKSEEKVFDEEHFKTVKTQNISEDEKTKEITEEFIKQKTAIKKLLEEELSRKESETEKKERRLSKESSDEEKKLMETQQSETKIDSTDVHKTDWKSLEKTDFDKTTKKAEEIIEKVETKGKKKEQFDLQTENREIQKVKEKEILQIDTEIKRDGEKILTSSVEEKEEVRDCSRESEKMETKTVEEDSFRHSLKSSSVKTETSKSVSKTQKSVVSETKMENEVMKNLEIIVPESKLMRKIGDQLYSSEDSPRSTSLEESVKSPPGGEEMLSSTSSTEKQGDKSDIVFRHPSSAFLKADRRSGADLEPYSSSGESHYHSFEQISSRPCSSDVEGLLTGNIGTAGSSEYESAISQEISGKHSTSTDYQTAVSSLSSRESIKSLDSESSGHLASVEISSEASETLIPSALELDRDIEAPGSILSDDDGVKVKGITNGEPSQEYKTQASSPRTTKRTVDEDFEIISESEVASWIGGVSEDEEVVLVTGEEALSSEENAQKMKRSHEMTFQPEPKPIVFSESLDGFLKDGSTEKVPLELSVDDNSSIISALDEKFGSSLEESGSVLSMSFSTTSEPSAMRTVIELSHTDSEKMDVSGTSIDSVSREDLDSINASQPQILTNEMSTSTATPGIKKETESVTMTTSSSSDVQGASCVSTQVTSVSRKSSMADEEKPESELQKSTAKSIDLSQANGPTQVEYVADYDEVESTKAKKSQGHKRKESTSNFMPAMMWSLSEGRTQKLRADITETDYEYGSDKYVYDVTLTEKEVKNDEKKEADDSEGYDRTFEALESKVSEGEEVEEFKEYDNNRPQSQTSRIDSESGRRPLSSVFSEDQPDSELSELMKQGSSETEREGIIERPFSPEPEEMENKDITPEFSSEAQASVTELEIEYSGAYSRRDEYASHVSPIREEKSDTKFKETTEKITEMEEVVDGLRSQTSLESTIAEKHELETGEKEISEKKVEEKRASDVPDITITEHMTPISHQQFQYPEFKEEVKEMKSSAKTPDTPASTSSKTSSSSTEQGKEYHLEKAEIRKISEVLNEEKGMSESKHEKESLDSLSSDSFEMLDKPDITDEFVIIEEVGREAKENDLEGKSIKIISAKQKQPKRVKEEQDIIMSPPGPTTKMTDLKYYPQEEDPDLFSFDSDGSPQPTTRKLVEKIKKRPSKEEKDEIEYDQQIEQSKKWLETQFQGEQAAKIMGAYGYEMEFERAPLEDIKEEELNELDSSSKIGSIGSQKESLGSFGSVKDSFSSTPDYDVLAGRKYFTRSGDHDDVSMSSLQEFELIEKKLMENGKKSGSSSSQDSLSSKKLGTSSKSGQGDDISTGSLREFETLESACTTVVNMEKKAKQEEAILSEIDEGHESQISESESCETVSAVMKEKTEYDPEDFDKKMFEIDEIIKQAQSNVEKFSEMQTLEKVESIGRGDSYEEVAKVPDLELDMPFPGKLNESARLKSIKRSLIPYLTQVVTKKKVEEWRAAEKTEQQKTEVMSDKPTRTKEESSKQSELLENGGKIKSISADSLEIQTEKQIILEGKEDTISLDSYKRKAQKCNDFGFQEIRHKSDSMEEVSASLRYHDSSSGDYTSSGTDHTHRPPPRAEFLLGSTDSLDPSSSTATHATYQYETDSVMSSSFTSGDSNTMVSSADNLDVLISGPSVIDFSKNSELSKTDDWLENLEVGGTNPLEKKLIDQACYQTKHEIQKVSFAGPGAERALQEHLESIPLEEVIETEETDEDGNIHKKKVLRQRVVIRMDDAKKEKPAALQRDQVNAGDTQAFVTEITEPLGDNRYSHTTHKTTQMVPEVQKVVFRDPRSEKALQDYTEQHNTNEEVHETEEVDEYGNIQVKKVIRQMLVVKPEAEAEGAKQEIHLEVQKILFSDEDSEKDLKDLTKNLKTNEETTETEKVGEDGSINIKKKLKKKTVDFKQEDLETFEKQKKQAQKPEVIQLGPQVQKVIFKGPDAEKDLTEYAQSLKPEDDVIEIEETDENGDVHMKKLLRQRIIVRPNQELTKSELEQYLQNLMATESIGKEHYSHVIEKIVDVPTDIQKITFRGPDAEKQLQEFMQKQQQPEIEEIEEVDEHGNVHIKKVLRQRVVVRPGKEMTKDELERYLNQLEESESAKKSSQITHSRVDVPTDIQKITFRGPDAEKQLQEFMQQQQQPETEEIEEVDEHGNVHLKRIIKQRVIIRPRDIESGIYSQSVEVTHKDANKSSRILSKDKLQAYLDSLEDFESSKELPTKENPLSEETEDKEENIYQKKTVKQKVVLQPHEPSDRLLTEEEFQERLKHQQIKQTAVYFEKIHIGSTEPFVSEIIEPLDEEEFSHIIHRKVQSVPEVQKVVFRGPNAEQALKSYIEASDPGEDFEEAEEVDEEGNIHVKRILRRKIVFNPEELEKTGLTGEELKSYLKRFEFEYFEGRADPRVHPPDPNTSTSQILTKGFSSSVELTEKEGHSEGEKSESESASATRKESGISQRPPLVSDISMDDEAEYDPTEHDWRHQLEILHAEADEDEIDQNLNAALATSLSSQKKQ